MRASGESTNSCSPDGVAGDGQDADGEQECRQAAEALADVRIEDVVLNRKCEVARDRGDVPRDLRKTSKSGRESAQIVTPHRPRRGPRGSACVHVLVALVFRELSIGGAHKEQLQRVEVRGAPQRVRNDTRQPPRSPAAGLALEERVEAACERHPLHKVKLEPAERQAVEEIAQ